MGLRNGERENTEIGQLRRLPPPKKTADQWQCGVV